MLAMLGKGAREAGAGQPAEPGALAGAVAGQEMRENRGEKPCRSVRTPVLRGLESSAPLQFGATRGPCTPPSSASPTARIEDLQFGATRGPCTPPIFARGTDRGIQREKRWYASPTSGRNSSNRGGQNHAPGVGPRSNSGRSAPSLAGMPTSSCSCTRRGAARLSAARHWRVLGTRQSVGAGCWEIWVRSHIAEKRRGDT